MNRTEGVRGAVGGRPIRAGCIRHDGPLTRPFRDRGTDLLPRLFEAAGGPGFVNGAGGSRKGQNSKRTEDVRGAFGVRRCRDGHLRQLHVLPRPFPRPARRTCWAVSSVAVATMAACFVAASRGVARNCDAMGVGGVRARSMRHVPDVLSPRRRESLRSSGQGGPGSVGRHKYRESAHTGGDITPRVNGAQRAPQQVVHTAEASMREFSFVPTRSHLPRQGQRSLPGTLYPKSATFWGVAEGGATENLDSPRPSRAEIGCTRHPASDPATGLAHWTRPGMDPAPRSSPEREAPGLCAGLRAVRP